jgi:LytS/YehU family sensor histidine kinase
MSANAIVGSVLLSILMTFVFHQFFAIKGRQIEAERRATAAQLRLLQAQIEPHFLFNTLANVQGLMDHDVLKAKQMLDSFTSYLRASLGSLRNEESAVADELNLARSYLQLLQGRMEDRLRFSISADEGAQRQPLPALLLQPLVENAVVHGLEPSIEGGTVRVSAHVSGAQLVLEVEDDGRGLHAPARPGARRGHGLALANIRQRLLARYGSAATLDVQQAHPGTLARITLPLQATTP